MILGGWSDSEFDTVDLVNEARLENGTLSAWFSSWTITIWHEGNGQSDDLWQYACALMRELTLRERQARACVDERMHARVV